jgi:hypothetical protein
MRNVTTNAIVRIADVSANAACHQLTRKRRSMFRLWSRTTSRSAQPQPTATDSWVGRFAPPGTCSWPVSGLRSGATPTCGAATEGRPNPGRATARRCPRKKRRIALRYHATTVSGFTMTSDERHSARYERARPTGAGRLRAIVGASSRSVQGRRSDSRARHSQAATQFAISGAMKCRRQGVPPNEDSFGQFADHVQLS